MTNIQGQKQHSITLTSGSIKDLASDCESLKIRGSVSLLHEVHLKNISSHGYSSFHSHVVADVLKNSGSCVIKGNCMVKEIVNAGSLTINNGQTSKVMSSGKLTIKQLLRAEEVESSGIVQAKEMHTKHFHIKLSGKSTIERLITEEAYVEKDRKSFSLSKKKLICQLLKGKYVQLINTDAEIVEADVAIIGKNCAIQTLYYKEHYSISPDSNVQLIVRNEQ